MRKFVVYYNYHMGALHSTSLYAYRGGILQKLELPLHPDDIHYVYRFGRQLFICIGGQVFHLKNVSDEVLHLIPPRSDYDLFCILVSSDCDAWQTAYDDIPEVVRDYLKDDIYYMIERGAKDEG